MANPFLAETAKVVNLVPPVSFNSGKSVQYVSLANYGHVDIIITTGVNSTAASTGISFQRATNTSGGQVQTLITGNPLFYWLNAAALSSASIANDTYVKTAISSAAFHLTSTSNATYIIPFDADDFDRSLASVQVRFNTLGITIDNSGASTIGAVTAILSQPRYSGANAASAL